MNPAQLENIELRLAAVRGRPWVVTPSVTFGYQPEEGEGAPTESLAVGPRDVAPTLWADPCPVDHVRFTLCESCEPKQHLPRRGIKAWFAGICETCRIHVVARLRADRAAVMSWRADADECEWLAKAPEDIEALIHAVKSLSDEREALRRDLERERTIAKGVADERSKAILELSRLKSSLATLREVLQ